MTRETRHAVASHYNVAAGHRHLRRGAGPRPRQRRARDQRRSSTPAQKDLPRGSQIIVRGQIETMTSSFIGLLGGPGARDRAGLPADRRELPVVARSVHHHLGAAGGAGRHRLDAVPDAHDVQRAVADRRDHVHGRRDGEQHPGGQLREGRSSPRGVDAVDAAIEAGFTRFRPVLMTALAMIIGMVPMALGLGEGGEQNAPLGRAVIGGLALATVATLFFVPSVFALLHGTDARLRRAAPRYRITRMSNRRSSGRWSAACCCSRWRLGLAFWGISTRAKALDGRDAGKRASWRCRPSRSSRPSAARRSRRSCCPARCRRSPTRRSTRAPTATCASGTPTSARACAPGQLLADIDTPEVDQQLEQARADLATAEANARLAQTTAERYRDLIKTDSVSKQDLDNANGSLEAQADRGRRRREANVSRLEQLQAFGRIDGAVRRRHHRAQHRRRRADRFGQQREGAVPRRRGAPAARVRQRARDLLARGAAGDEGRPDADASFPDARSPARWRGRRSRSTSPRGRC